MIIKKITDIKPQKWNTYGKLPPSGPGSTVAAARNFIKGLETTVNFIKDSLRKDKISILGKDVLQYLVWSCIRFRFKLWRYDLDADLPERY